MDCQIFEGEKHLSIKFENCIENGKLNEVALFSGFEQLFKRFNLKVEVKKIFQDLQCVNYNNSDTLVVKYKRIRINLENYEVYQGRSKIKLTKKELFLLMYLIRKRGKILTRERIINDVWQESYFESCDRVIDNCICKLRKKFLDISHNLETFVGLGYKLKK